MLKFISEQLASPTIAKILGALSPMALAAAIWGRETAIQAAKELSPQSVAVLLTLSVVVILALLAWAFYLLPSFRYLPKYQFCQHRVTGLYYCPPCRNKKPLSPLKKEISGWRCPFCKDFYKDPDHKDPPPPKAKPSFRY
jgi:hypothetical protein